MKSSNNNAIITCVSHETKKRKCIASAFVFALIFTLFTQVMPSGVSSADEYYQSNPYIRIGLVYDSGAVDSFQTSATAEKGFIIGYSAKNTGTSVTALLALNCNQIVVAKNENLSKNSAGKYYVNNANIIIGKYCAEFSNTFTNFEEAYAFIGSLPKDIFTVVYPAHINGSIAVRAGSFSSADAVANYITDIASKTKDYTLKQAGASATGTIIINPETDTVLFAFENSNNDMAVVAREGYTKTTAGNTYTGAFAYRTRNSAIEVINILTLEDYIKGVIPYEIYPEWEAEALKAFSVVVRTYTIKSAHRHASQGFMLCNSTHCQMFAGWQRATDATNAAVDSTQDLIITYKGAPIEAVYHASSGGVTENHYDAWGGTPTHPYLVSVQLPFEDYTNESNKNSLWKKTVSPKELSEYLRTSSSYASRFAGINSDISKIKITERSTPSNYAKSMNITDKNGNSVNLTNSDAIRSAFARYANSANMNIYTSFTYPVIGESNKVIETQDLYVLTSSGTEKIQIEADEITILSASGKKTFGTGEYNFVFDGKGWGHGVGLSQYAMQDYAKLGNKYDAIIKVFYTGVELSKLTSVKK